MPEYDLIDVEMHPDGEDAAALVIPLAENAVELPAFREALAALVDLASLDITAEDMIQAFVAAVSRYEHLAVPAWREELCSNG